MSVLDPDTVAGFTPSPDCVRDDIDIVAANVFGAVWRFSKGQRGQCDATLVTISKRAGYGSTATRMRLRLLVEHGWIVEERRDGRPTVYRDSGRWVLKVVGEDTEAPTPDVARKRSPQREALPSGDHPNARRCPPQRETLPTPTRGVAQPQREALAEESLLKKDFKKELKTGADAPVAALDTAPERQVPGGSDADRRDAPNRLKWAPFFEHVGAALGVSPYKAGGQPLAFAAKAAGQFGGAVGHDVQKAIEMFDAFAAWARRAKFGSGMRWDYVDAESLQKHAGKFIAGDRATTSRGVSAVSTYGNNPDDPSGLKAYLARQNAMTGRPPAGGKP